MKPIIDEKKIDELLTRSVAEILPSREEFKKRLMSGDRLRIYMGTDATGSSLHLGHATNYMVMERLRELGHEIILLIGDFTARIGDPTDKTATRKQLTRADVKENIKTWLGQIKPVLDMENPENPVKIVYNHDWLSKLTFEDVINIASNFTVQQMLERDMFEKRLKEEKPIFLHEFFYPLMQGYDSVELDVDMEICGNDQKFNALAGRTLLRKIKNKEKFVFITTLLENPVTGEKMMSKSLGTGVFLDRSAEDMYGQLMAQPDENIPQLFVDCTLLPMTEVKEIVAQLRQLDTNPRDIKMRLALEITKLYHGAEKAKLAEEYFIKTVQNKELPDEIEEKELPAGRYFVADLLEKIGLATSKSEARRLIEGGGVKIDGQVLTDKMAEVELKNEFLLIQKGKRGVLKVRGGN